MTALAHVTISKGSSKLYPLILSALGTALIAVGAMITVQLPLGGPIPFTMQTCVVLIIALAFPPSSAWISPALYIGMGAIGLPVFAGFKGGLGILVGPTAGFIWGFLLAGLIVGLIRQQGRSQQQTSHAHFALISQALLALLLIYACGTTFYILTAGVDIMAALALCVVPFVIPEIFKFVIAITISATIRRFLH